MEKEKNLTDDEYILLRRFRRLKCNNFGSITIELVSGGTEALLKGAGDDVKISVVKNKGGEK